MEEWGGTGIIARIENAKIARAILGTGLPVIGLDLSEEQMAAGSPLARISEIASDSAGAALRAAEHLIERGFRHYAFVGIPGRIWSRRREESFQTRIREAGFSCHLYTHPRRRRDREWGQEHHLLSEWLRTLPRPVGLMACNDDRGRQVLEACRAAGLKVPEEIAVVGVDNDDLLCELSEPPLSSVDLNTEKGGYEAAALLDRLMAGRTKRRRRILVEPRWVVTRQSTDVMALEDQEVVRALHFIREEAGRPLGVDEVVRATGLSRRALEIRFRRAAGRSVHAEIQRVRLERAEELLVQTELTMPQIAEASGFGSASYLALVFRKELDRTPLQYRQQSRGRLQAGKPRS
jgi:LacI family transcriptional regulator